VVVSNQGTIQQVYPDQSLGGFGTGSITGNTTGLIAGANITIIGNVISAVIPPPPSGGGATITGSPITGTFPIWTGASSIGNSNLIDDGSELVYTNSGNNVTINGTSLVFSSSVTIQAGNPGTTQSLNFQAAHGSGVNNTITLNGNFAFGGGPSSPPHGFFIPQILSAALATPRVNPSGVTKGCIVFCSDAKGAADGATWGSTATGSGNGAILRYTGSAWIVIG
jgi:hypothetical protein